MVSTLGHFIILFYGLEIWTELGGAVLLLLAVIQLPCGFVVLGSTLSLHSQSGVPWLLYMLLPLHGIGASFLSSGLGLCYGNIFSKEWPAQRYLS